MHETFAIGRKMRAPVSRVFAAWADPEAKRQWFACHDEWVSLEYNLDFRVGGQERNRVADSDGVPHTYEARYLDIVPQARIIYAYDMKLGETRISASLATITFEATPSGTTMLFHGASRLPRWLRRRWLASAGNRDFGRSHPSLRRARRQHRALNIGPLSC